MSRVSSDIDRVTSRLDQAKTMHMILKYIQEDPPLSETHEAIDIIIVEEINRLKLQHLKQLKDIYDRGNLAMALIGMPGIEKRLSRYPQLSSSIGFAHEFDNLSKDETHHILV